MMPRHRIRFRWRRVVNLGLFLYQNPPFCLKSCLFGHALIALGVVPQNSDI